MYIDNEENIEKGNDISTANNNTVERSKSWKQTRVFCKKKLVED